MRWSGEWMLPRAGKDSHRIVIASNPDPSAGSWLGGRHRVGDQLFGTGNVGLAAGAGQQPVMADAMKPLCGGRNDDREKSNENGDDDAGFAADAEPYDK